MRAVYWVKLTLSVGRSRSKNDAPDINHFDIGAQKCTVNGPAAAAEAVLNGPKGGLTKIDNTDWTDAQLRKDQRTYLCTIAKGENPVTGMETRVSLMCKD